MSRYTRVNIVLMGFLLAGLAGGCLRQEPQSRLAGIWVLTEVNGMVYASPTFCVPAPALTISGDEQLTRLTECGDEFDFPSSQWITRDGQKIRGASSSASLSDDGAVSIELVLETLESEVTTFTRVTYDGSLSEDGTALNVTGRTFMRHASTDPWSPIGTSDTLVFEKQ
jgi:hypothetical protein